MSPKETYTLPVVPSPHQRSYSPPFRKFPPSTATPLSSSAGQQRQQPNKHSKRSEWRDATKTIHLTQRQAPPATSRRIVGKTETTTTKVTPEPPVIPSPTTVQHSFPRSSPRSSGSSSRGRQQQQEQHSQTRSKSQPPPERQQSTSAKPEQRERSSSPVGRKASRNGHSMERRQQSHHHSSWRTEQPKRRSSSYCHDASSSGGGGSHQTKRKQSASANAAFIYDDGSSIVEGEDYDSPVKMVICSRSSSAGGMLDTPSRSGGHYTRRGGERVVAATDCIEDVGYILKSHLKQCLMLTSDLYDRECAEPQMYRGSDGEFFVSGGMTADDQTQSATSTSGYNNNNDDLTEPPSIFNSVRTPRSESVVEPPDDTVVTPTMDPYWKAQVAHAMEITQDDIASSMLLPPEQQDTSGTLQRGHLRRPRGAFDVEEEERIILDNHDEQNTQHLPYDEEHLLSRTTRDSNVANYSPALRDLRLRIFEADQKNEYLLREDQQLKKDAIAVKYSRALEDLAGQDESIRILRKELTQARTELENVRQQLRRNETTAAPSLSYTIPQQEQAAKIFQERIDVEERLRKELTLNGRLMNRIASLEKETERLTAELVETRESVEIKAWTPQRPTRGGLNTSSSMESPGSSPSRASDLSGMKADLLKMRTEAAELRAQLAESRAARLSAESAKAEIERTNQEKREEAEQLKSELNEVSCKFNEEKKKAKALEEEEAETRSLKEELATMRLQLDRSDSEVAELKVIKQTMEQLRVQLTVSQAACLTAEKARSAVENERDEARNEALVLQSKLDEMQTEVAEIKFREESSEKERSEKISRLREELGRMRSDFEKVKTAKDDHLKTKQSLEESLAEAQDELAQLRSNLADAEHELRMTKEKTEEQIHLSDTEMEQLRQELKAVKDKLSKTHGEIIEQAASHLKEKKQLEEDLEKSLQAAETLQYRLVAMDDRIALAESTENQRRVQFEDEDRRSDASSTLRRLSGDVFERLKKKLDSLEK